MTRHIIQGTASVDGDLVGRPLDRIDGVLKVRGLATYGYEHRATSRPAYGFILGATIGRGRLADIDTVAAERAPGVLLVLTHRNAPEQAVFGEPTTPEVPQVFTRARPVLASDAIRFHDEPVALVVAETFEEARHAASLITCRYEQAEGAFDFEAGLANAYRPARANAGLATDSIIGDVDAAMKAAPVALDQTYETAFASHNPLEPHAAMAAWDGDVLTVHTATQTLANIRAGLAATLRLPLEKVRIVSPFIGGGFGSKLIVHAETVLAALAARKLGRPVKVALTRQQMFANAGHRPTIQHRMRLAATRDGQLTAFSHDVIETTARCEEFAEQTAATGRSLYAAPNRRTTHRLVRLDTNRGEWMRAPGEAPGLFAIECAMDELAEALRLDPIELRIRNEPERDPERNVPFSTRHLIACMQGGARRFSWDERPRRPGSRREGRKLIGYGMAAATRANYLGPTAVRVTIDARGEIVVQTDMTDIGTGTYTILAQVAAERLGVSLAAVRVELGDSALPRSAGSGGSWGATSTCTATHHACLALREKILVAAREHERSPLRGANIAEARFARAALNLGSQSHPLRELIAAVAPEGISAEGSAARGETYQSFSQHSHGAHFAEVSVDLDTGEPRLRRMLGVFAAGRILNPKTARSQMIGGIIWGVGAALTEETVLDPRHGHFVNHDLGDYHLPAHADTPDVDAVFLDEHDDKANPLGAKGVGELGNCGASAAIANAIYNATGIRVRSLPITLDKLLPGLPIA
ncbi:MULTISPECIES: xanthine dehydrogenase family protein molybdopterin-binding subunit [unclassified Bosea (in: a-proteobacteria)]|uniref:xanthine dehydrogenase family protein molybdopterin-binding subunit n=1 Tax=unclassified Bosea (in: a-proteobacteria) TaxID=2653178 RepID=UPI000F762D58|nr:MULTISPECIES: xanthine dehydrogenase family protein molybdopterin-binding subunit [unclassified Bosea (in: a-proteobacteria)]AZO78218.1 xanthine dehydrogenase [Bosea sp. Tri-49]RXT20295.1 xanthine dehydrogenase [Bosea sp. Tri-39]RXT37167.1 xanthine dehydrogenase [Bosea sp. Tri-54]